jgi:hypothetical protein
VRISTGNRITGLTSQKFGGSLPFKMSEDNKRSCRELL